MQKLGRHRHYRQLGTFDQEKNEVKRMGNSTAKQKMKDFGEKKAKYLKDIKTLVDKHNIPPWLIINWDYTGIHLVPNTSGQWQKRAMKSSK